MKLRNLMYATMIACAFASCSNDDVPTPDNGNPDVEGGTSLALKIDQPTTKAGGGDIRNLTVLVFNGAGTNDIKLEKKATVEEEGTDEVLQTKLTPGNKTVLVLANAKDEVATFNEETTSYQNVLDATTKFELYSETDGDFSMNSKAYEVTLKANVTNYLGYGLSGDKDGNYLPQAGDGAVKMYRNVAKVVLKGIKIKESVAEGQQYPNAELKLKEIFILHGHNNSKLVGANGAEWGSTMMDGSYGNGVVSDAYTKYSEDVTETDKIFNYIQDPTSNYVYEPTFVSVFDDVTVSKTEAYAPKDMKTFYPYENTSGEDGIQTLLVIKGDFSYDGIKSGDSEPSRITESNRYYSFAIGNTGTVSEKVPTDFVGLRADDKIHGVMRNLQYNTTITVTGPGYKTPVGPKYDETFLDVKVEVVPFGEVDQDVEI